MADRWQSVASALSALIMSALILPTFLTAQTETPQAKPAVLSRKQASRLIVEQPKPEYPPLAKVNYIQGSVRIQLAVALDGTVSEAHVIEGHPFLAAAALKAVRRWIYRLPENGAAKRGFLTFVDVNFTLRRHDVSHLPPQPERDLERQVQRPEVLEKPESAAAVNLVRLHVLVGPDGRVLDAQPVSGSLANLSAARRNVEQWKFQPARWGNQSVPWYMDLDVPAMAYQGTSSE